MTEAELQMAMKLQSRMTVLHQTLSILDKLENNTTKGGNIVVVTNYNDDGVALPDDSVALPDPLKSKVIRVVREYCMSELQEIEKQFDNL